jgi:hypothetical protein
MGDMDAHHADGRHADGALTTPEGTDFLCKTCHKWAHSKDP